MFKTFMQTICQMGIFMICAQAIMHFRPNKAYEKYMKMLVSAMILVQVFLPILNLLTTGGQLSLEQQIHWFEEEMRQGRDEANEAALRSDEILGQMTLEEVRRRMTESSEEEEGQDAGTAAEQMKGAEKPAEEMPEPEAEMNSIDTIKKIKIDIGSGD